MRFIELYEWMIWPNSLSFSIVPQKTYTRKEKKKHPRKKIYQEPCSGDYITCSWEVGCLAWLLCPYWYIVTQACSVYSWDVLKTVPKSCPCSLENRVVNVPPLTTHALAHRPTKAPHLSISFLPLLRHCGLQLPLCITCPTDPPSPLGTLVHCPTRAHRP